MKDQFIKCPHCGQEFLPVEIYIPDEFFGRPNEIERDSITGKIKDYFGKAPNYSEEYRCDKCSTKFKVFAEMKFVTSVIDYGVNDLYSTKINKAEIAMDEG